ncbi:MAG: hypothetical protein M1821_009630 [Bathelium mastoideum]|nr:MAG: hypothetical protein M1821_009630 [Bathelium mastoideum]KAI9688856.1 MAG: hypothetical protein M1822_001213 [Bathelium mastoideum]
MAQPQQPSPVGAEFMSEIVEVKVGNSTKPFHVHQSKLCSNSEYFKAALNNNWQKSESLHAELPEDDGEVFGVYVNWLYSRKVEAFRGLDVGWSKSYEILIEAFILGDKLLDIDFKDAVVDAIVHLTMKPDANGTWAIPPGKNVSRLYERTLKGSKARRMMVDLHVMSATPRMFDSEEMKDEYCFDFVVELLRAMFEESRDPQGKANTLLRWRNQCQYHEHGTGNPCYKDRR